MPPRYDTVHFGPTMSFDCPDWPPNWPEIDASVQRVLGSGDWGRYHSETCRKLQERIAEFTGISEVRLCCSGTAALEIALRAAQIGERDEVALAAYDFPGNFRTIELLGARPLLLDVAGGATSINPDQLQSLANADGERRIRAVIASHLYGRPADTRQLREICDSQGWILVEDACQAVGMSVRGQRVGSHGHFATLSFGGSKPVSAGGGGALLAGDARLAARLGSLIDRPGDAFPLSPLQAAVIGPQLDRLDELNHMRLRTVEFLQREVVPELSSWEWLSGTEAGVVPTHYKVAWLAESPGHRARILAAAEQEGLPLGPGFRALSRCSGRRCEKPVPTPLSDRLGECLFVLDHRALLLPKTRHGELAESLLRVCSTTC
jgi:dTDP-4-amino-4,6-dideoxygalactose transaminase